METVKRVKKCESGKNRGGTVKKEERVRKKKMIKTQETEDVRQVRKGEI